MLADFLLLFEPDPFGAVLACATLDFVPLTKWTCLPHLVWASVVPLDQGMRAPVLFGLLSVPSLFFIFIFHLLLPSLSGSVCYALTPRFSVSNPFF